MGRLYTGRCGDGNNAFWLDCASVPGRGRLFSRPSSPATGVSLSPRPGPSGAADGTCRAPAALFRLLVEPCQCLASAPATPLTLEQTLRARKPNMTVTGWCSARLDSQRPAHPHRAAGMVTIAAGEGWAGRPLHSG
jgi:hypothetical protein